MKHDGIILCHFEVHVQFNSLKMNFSFIYLGIINKINNKVLAYTTQHNMTNPLQIVEKIEKAKIVEPYNC